MRKTDLNPLQASRKSSRVFNDAGAWFYHTREGQRGPFASQSALRADMAAYVGTMEFISENDEDTLGDIDCQDVTCVELSVPMF